MQKSPFALQHNIVPIQKTEVNIPVSTYSNNYIVPVQFPLSLAYACTVHKVQGLTLPNVVFSFTLEKQRTFNSGQIYVAISRVRALTNLYIW